MNADEFDEDYKAAVAQRDYLMNCFNRLPYLEDYQLIQAEVLLQEAGSFDDIFTMKDQLVSASISQEDFDKIYEIYLDKLHMLKFHYNNAKIFFDGLL